MAIASNNGHVKRYDPLGHCMYCGSKHKLSREHIIPFGLGGNLIFADASCGKCAEITSDFERYCLRNMFQAARTHLNLPTRNKKNKPKTLRLSYFKNEGDHEWINVPVSDHPYAIILPIFQSPTIISQKPHIEGLMTDGVAMRAGPHFIDNLNKFGPNHAYTQELSPDLFGRLLAKIAHGFAVAELGERAFQPFLQGLILGTAPFSSACIGGGTDNNPNDLFHQLKLCWRGSYLVCSINLFWISSDTPAAEPASVYEIVVGMAL